MYSLKYLRSTTLGWKDRGIKISEFVAKLNSFDQELKEKVGLYVYISSDSIYEVNIIVMININQRPDISSTSHKTIGLAVFTLYSTKTSQQMYRCTIWNKPIPLVF